MSAYSIVLSNDGNTAFVSLTRSGNLKIIDVSNIESPTVVNTMKLRPVDFPFLGKFLSLSPDGKTLFASNMHRLEIIDISDLEVPILLGELEDEVMTKRLSPIRGITLEYRVSMALSKDNQTLYVGGLGLQIIDISDLRKPRIFSSNSTLLERETDKLYRTEIALSSDREILYLANGTLGIYNISNPRILRPIGSYSLSSSYFISSVFLSKKLKIAYIAAFIPDGETIYEKIDISDLAKPVRLASYNLNHKSPRAPYILGLCGNENLAFILVYKDYFYQEVGVFHLTKGEFRLEAASLIIRTTSLVILPDESNIMIAQNAARFMAVELFAAYPNKRIFSFSNNSIGHLTTRTDVPITSNILFSDGNTLLTKRGDSFNSKYIFELVNVSDYSNPTLLGSFEEKNDLRNVKLLEQAKRAVIFFQWSGLSLFDLSDLTQPTLIGKFSLSTSFASVLDAHFSSDAKRGFVISTDNQRLWMLWIIDFSEATDFQNGQVLKEIDFADSIEKVLLTKNNNILLLLGNKITVFNVTDLHKPFQVSTIFADQDGEATSVKSAALSSDEKTLFARVYINSRYCLKIYDVRDFSAIRPLGELTLPSVPVSQDKDLIFSSDEKTAYLGTTGGYLLAINISNRTSPFVQGTFYLPDVSDLRAVQLAKDDKTLFYAVNNTLRISSLAVPHTLYLDTESVRLGQKYSETVSLFKLNKTSQEYGMFGDSHKFIKASLFEIKINPSKRAPDCTYLPLPYWMSFDKENQIFTVEPKKQQNLGTYTFYSAFSTKLPENAFKDLSLPENTNDEDLITMLISQGFMDNQMYLTSNFGSYGDFRIPKEFVSIKKELFSTLKQYYFETFTMFDIFPSLDVSCREDKISINTLSYNSIRVEIRLLDKQHKFVNKQYASIKPVITENQIILEGSQKEINNALELLVINLDKGSEKCDGTIAVWDHLNPTVTKSLLNIAKFFKINQVPQVQIPIQQQIDSHNVYTGTYFTINFKNGTFIDTWNNDLSFELVNGDSGKSLPAWISFSNMSLRGTPPEEITWSGMKFDLIVKNEFKETQVPFVLNVKLSPGFVLKLLLRYSPYILTMIGLIVYANKIYNIVAKKRYRYPKDFYIKVGEEITSREISPFVFIRQEKAESKVIMEYLQEILNEKIGKKFKNNTEFASYFVENNRIDKQRLEKRVEEILIEAPEKIVDQLDLYSKGSETSKTLIIQLIFNQLTFWLLDSDIETKKFFDIMKSNWIDLVEWDSSGMCCQIRENRLFEFLLEADLESNGPKEKTDGYRKMKENDTIHVELLKDAILAHALGSQSIDYLAIRAHIVVKEKLGKNKLKELIKLDLENVNFSDKGKMGYGMYYKIQNDVLSFYGVAEEKFANKTIVVQITDIRHRILNEIWIRGVAKGREKYGNHGSLAPETNENIARGNHYEVY